jgi:hypothetical protein
MLNNSFANAKGKVESAMSYITLFEMLHNPQSVQIMIETQTMTAQALIQGALSCMTERRMADIVNQRQGFGKILIQTQRNSSGAGNLSNFDRMSQATAKVI